MSLPSGIEILIFIIALIIIIKIIKLFLNSQSQNNIYETKSTYTDTLHKNNIVYSYDQPYKLSRPRCIYFDCPKCQRLYHAVGAPFITPSCESCGTQLIQRPMEGENKLSKTSCPNGGTHQFHFFNSFGSQKRRCTKCSYIDPDFYIPNYYKERE